MALARVLQYEAAETPADEEFERCGVSFQPSWQPSVWCSCDRPLGHAGDHFGMPRVGRWEVKLRIG